MGKYLQILLILSLLFTPCPGQEKEIREDIEVTNIEIPLRVLHKGKPVSGLKKKDFLLFLNGKPQKIHGFYEHKRKIEIGESLYTAKGKKREPRLFVLVFNLTSFHLDVKKGIDYFFDRILKEDDRLMVLANNSFLPEKIVKNIPKEKAELNKIITRESIAAKRKLLKIISNLETILLRCKYEINSKSRMGGKSDLQLIGDYLLRYLEIFKFYKKNYLIPDLDKYYHFAKYLQGKNLKKWVINFYQLEKFPKMKNSSTFRRNIDAYISAGEAATINVAERVIAARSARKLLYKIDRELGVADDFPVEQVKKLFLQVNTTFHTIFMKSPEVINSEDYELKQISSDIENSLREITKATGGDLILSNNLEIALERISEKEDIFYILSYAPPEHQKGGSRIKIRLKDKPYKLIYSNAVYEDFFRNYLKKKKRREREIKIEGLEFKNRLLSFYISDLKFERTKKSNTGKVLVQIKIVNDNSIEVFNQKRALLLDKEKNKLSIRFNDLKKGEYFIFVNLTDIISGKNTEEQKKIFVK